MELEIQNLLKYIRLLLSIIETIIVLNDETRRYNARYKTMENTNYTCDCINSPECYQCEKFASLCRHLLFTKASLDTQKIYIFRRKQTIIPALQEAIRIANEYCILNEFENKINIIKCIDKTKLLVLLGIFDYDLTHLDANHTKLNDIIKELDSLYN